MKSKVFFILDSLAAGGAERVVAVLSSSLSKKYDVEILCFFDIAPFYNVDEKVKIVNIEKRCKSTNTLMKMLFLRRYIKANKNKSSIVISFMMPFYIMSGIALQGVRIPIIASERSNPFIESRIRRLLTKILSKRFSLFVAQTEGARAFFSHYKTPSTIIYNPLNSSFLNQTHVDPEELKIVSVGRLIPVKNHKLLVDAFELAHKEIQESSLVIYGDGCMKQELQIYIDQKGLAKSIILAGTTQDVPKALKEASVYACTSNYEGMPNAVIEAMACGIPVVSTKVFGSVDVIKNGENGFLVDIGNTKELAKAFIALLKDKKLRLDIGGKAIAIKNIVDPQLINNKWETIIKDCINQYYM